MIILLPESEGKVEGGNLPPLKNLHPITEQLFETIISYSDSKEKLYGVTGKKMLLADKANHTLKTAPTLPAIERFSGVVYDALSYETLTQKTFADAHIFILTAMFGLVKATEPIPDYKLKINKLQAAKLWKSENGKRIGKQFVIDLLPQAHKKAMHFRDGVRVEFIFRKNGKSYPAGHAGKHIKGRFVRFIVEHKIEEVSALLSFCEEGFVGTRVNKGLIEFVRDE